MNKGFLKAALAVVVSLCGGNAWAQDQGMPSSTFAYFLVAIVLGGALISILVIRSAVQRSKFSLADALSEEVEVNETDASGVTLKDANGQPLPKVTVLRASSSRLIALMGLMTILLLFLGFGACAIFRFCMTGQLPDSTDNVIKFLTGGLTLFAPYLVNKFASVFESMKPAAQ